MRFHPPVVLAVTAIARIASGTVVLVKEKDLDTTIPEACKNALTAELDCSTQVTVSADPLEAIQTIFMVGEAVFDKICSEECQDSLNAWVDGVRDECDNTEEYPILGLTVVPLYFAGGQLWLHNMMCMEDENGYCFLHPLTFFDQGCSYCHYQFAANVQSFEPAEPLYSEEDYSSLLEDCGVTSEVTATTIYVSPLPAETTAITADTLEAEPTETETTTESESESESDVESTVPSTSEATASSGTTNPEPTSTDDGSGGDNTSDAMGISWRSVGYAPAFAGLVGALILQ
ncbi:Alcohol dehydrogenase GroES-like domain family protein [Zalerion maritima]|uniref:Alcohol dehydrogenase GroES-like domain family protein n=1 Tax=Zalerion maritima TaxID=339359 RepID=A0AAD5RS46_9PEZI|nr:Alcohol dehydrogenase GroES-like domain family protein [Zalerion maritima]